MPGRFLELKTNPRKNLLARALTPLSFGPWICQRRWQRQIIMAAISIGGVRSRFLSLHLDDTRPVRVMVVDEAQHRYSAKCNHHNHWRL